MSDTRRPDPAPAGGGEPCDFETWVKVSVHMDKGAEQGMDAQAILASNTSMLPISEFGSEVRDQGRLVIDDPQAAFRGRFTIVAPALSEAGYFHLFAYNPETFPITRLSYGNWHDIDPAVSPDGFDGQPGTH